MTKAKRIRLLNLRDVQLACVAYKGSFQGIGTAYGQLMQWARAEGFTDAKTHKTITLYHDDPAVVGMNNVRQSACIITDRDFSPMGDIKSTTLRAGKCAVGRYEITYFEFKAAWTEMVEWVKENNLKASGKARFEVYHNNSSTHPQNKCIIDICIPVN